MRTDMGDTFDRVRWLLRIGAAEAVIASGADMPLSTCTYIRCTKYESLFSIILCTIIVQSKERVCSALGVYVKL